MGWFEQGDSLFKLCKSRQPEADFLYNKEMNVYRITARDQNGIVSQRETEAVRLHLAIEGSDDIVKPIFYS
jgi:hypothetical protein